MTAWLTDTAELDAYDGVRLGDEHAFRSLAEALQPTLWRLACLYVDDADVDALVIRTWDLALHGLDMFRWQTPLATWIAGITVALGRTRQAVRASPAVPPPPAPARAAPEGPSDWSDLPWSQRWEQAAATLTGALAALPLDRREVLHGHDVERWSSRRVCDVFGLPEAVHGRLLADARTRLRDALASLVGATGGNHHRDAQVAAVTAWLHSRREDRSAPLDPRTVVVFHRWWTTRERPWRRLILRRPPAPGRSGPRDGAGTAGRRPGGRPPRR